MKKISTKIIMTIIICCITLSSILGAISIIVGKTLINKEAMDKLSYMSQSTGGDLNKKLEIPQNKVEYLSYDVINTFDIQQLKSDPQYIERYKDSLASDIKNYSEGSKSYSSMYFFFNSDLTGGVGDVYLADTKGTGDFERQSELTKEKYDSNNKSMQWYYEAIKQENGKWSIPYTSSVINSDVITYSKPVFKDNTLIGVAAVDLKFSDIKNLINGIKVYSTGYATLYNDKYDYLVHPDFTYKDNLATVKDGVYKDIYEQMKANQAGVIKYKSKNGQNKLLAYSKLSNGWVLTVAPPIDEVLSAINRLTIVISTIIIIGIVLSVIAALYLGKKISEPIKVATELINTISKGDLSSSLDKKSEKFSNHNDELGIMIKALFDLKINLIDVVDNLRDSSNNIFQYSKSLSTNTNETLICINNVSNTISELASDATEHAVFSQNGLENIRDLSRDIEIALQSSDMVKETSNIAKEMSSKGSESLDILTEKFKINSDVISKISIIVDNLDNKSGSIDNIVHTINSVAEQTNLLALNAAIEAARAGEYGKGFSVVAEEIRHLAEQSTDYTKEIAIIISEIQQEISLAKNTMDTGIDAVNQANTAIVETEKSFNLIENSIENSLNHIDSLSRNLTNVAANKEKAIVSIERISTISEESAGAAEEVAAAVKEQTDAMNSISGTAEKLNEVAGRMGETVGMFKLDSLS
ncbi:methyl-accepting chemotaxis protein [Clostridium magnum]|uniref:Methyl-accepting chemotaxis protein McpC n=1 Tax=Clostridium magnum DSM 2767 TaxID=1121326 RepID=A0A162T023_9CLOT|nr:methyl-accepting chemotaxis protein [Clostridium magnum]KZL92077.1 methyl-accepting chemotaxis protein McpC [Clostridium magnum DSM 2767]SHH23411.1 methyl-accepting chemotaxis sensory transducer with Cache sensor [Clostridium magnum DSM 2767]